VLGVNAVFHDPAAALVVDGVIVAAAEEERFSRRKHGKPPVPFSTWELPEAAMRWCLAAGGLEPADLGAVAYSYDPRLARPGSGDVIACGWEGLRSGVVRHVSHHVAHAASAYLAAGLDDSAVLVLDGRGERTSHLSGHATDGALTVLAAQALPHSLGLLYEQLTEHLGFHRSSEEYKVMALAGYGRPRHLGRLRDAVTATAGGGFRTPALRWQDYAPRRLAGQSWTREHADLAASVQRRLEEVLLDLCTWLHERTGSRNLVMAGGVALTAWPTPRCTATARSSGSGCSRRPATRRRSRPPRSAGDSTTRNSGRVSRARGSPTAPGDVAAAAADVLAGDGLVAWYQGRSEYGPRALGHRSLLANPVNAGTLERLNDVKGREQFRPVAPVVLAERAAEIFDGPLPSPYMLFTHDVRPAWRERIPAVVHVDGTARAQTVERSEQPLLAHLLDEVEARTGVPVLVNTSLNTAGRPIVDHPRDALECFGSAPIDALVLGPFIVHRRPDGHGGDR
jgi:carbamoyltransferase